jgi:acetyl esterase/lipase
VEEARRLASPMTHVSATTKPTLIIHSDDDKSVPVQQAVDMSEKLKAAKVQHRFVHYTDRGHMGITDEVVKSRRWPGDNRRVAHEPPYNDLSHREPAAGVVVESRSRRSAPHGPDDRRPHPQCQMHVDQDDWRAPRGCSTQDC